MLVIARFSLGLSAVVLLTACQAPTTDLADNKSLTRRYFEEMWNEGLPDLADSLLAEDVVFRNPPVTVEGRAEYVGMLTEFRQAFPDLRFTIEDELAEGDRVATRWRVTGTQEREVRGLPATGATMDVTGMDIFRIVDGRIQEIWVNFDNLGQAQQLEWLPQPPGVTEPP